MEINSVSLPVKTGIGLQEALTGASIRYKVFCCTIKTISLNPSLE
jgi:hypothetical protein